MNTPTTVSVVDYLNSSNGKKALRLFKKHLNELGKTSCKDHGFTYALAYELHTALTERLIFSEHCDFNLKTEIMIAEPDDVVKNWMAWEFSDFAGNILGSDDDKYLDEVKAAFDNWLADDEN